MTLRFQLWPPHRLLVLFLVATLVPSAAMVWLGWQLVEQDRALERQRAQDALESTANNVSAGIERELASIDRDLPPLTSKKAELHSDTAVAVRLTRAGVMAHAGAPLLYQPVGTASRPGPPKGIWAEAERLEYAGDANEAAGAYRAIAASSDVQVRAGSLLGLARVLKTANRNDQALNAYTKLSTLTTATIDGDPADLMARWARVSLLDSLGRHQQQQAEAAALARDLWNGKWAIDRTTYLSYTQNIARLSDETPGPVIVTRTVLTEAVAWAWKDWQAESPGLRPSSGRGLLRVDETPVLLVWHEEDDGLLAFAASPAYLNDAWRHLWPDPTIAVALVDEAGQAVVGRMPANTTIPPVVKPSSDPRLPWTLRVGAVSTLDQISDTGSTRRQLLIAGLLLLLFLIPSTGYLVGRTVHRDLAVAKQQADFVSAVSHEFRSPLTSLSHLTSLLRGEFQPTEERRRQYYGMLARETDRLRRFVETLLDFGRMQAGATRYRLAPLDVSSCVAAVVEEFRNDAVAGAHRVSFSSHGQIPPVAADREALGRAIWNLLENAAKYSPDGSPIVVDVELADRDVAVRVIDQGSGIPADEQPHIFRQFYRGAAASASAVKGTGVGLAVVDHIVRAHGGTIRLDSRPEAGTTFSILLPIAEHGLSDTSMRAS